MVKILCPTDFSEAAEQAVTYAAQLARKAEGEITLLNVQSLSALSPVEVIRGKRMSLKAAEDRLEDQCNEITKVFKIPAYGAVETTKRSFADRMARKSAEYDLIVMGTNESNDHHQFFFGSKAYQVVKESFVPVLLVPEGCIFHPVSVIVFAFDYEQERKLPIIQLTQWAKLLSSTICVLQVDKIPATLETEQIAMAMQRQIKFYHDHVSIHFDTIYSDDLTETINEYVIRSGADILALCTTHHTFIEKLFHRSVIKSVSAIARYPVFIFHQ